MNKAQFDLICEKKKVGDKLKLAMSLVLFCHENSRQAEVKVYGQVKNTVARKVAEIKAELEWIKRINEAE